MKFQASHFSIGVGVFVFDPKTKRVLLGRRGPACSRGAGLWALPGGVVDPGETVIRAALREVEEETGLNVQIWGGYPLPGSAMPPVFRVPGLLAVTDHSDIHQQQDGNLLPHLSFWVLTCYASGTPEIREPGKCLGWEWIDRVTLSHLQADNPTSPQYYWTPLPLWRSILRPYLGDF